MFWNKKVAKTTRAWKELLRENLRTVVVDMFYADDPIIGMEPEHRKVYLKKFNDIVKDKDVMDRIVYLVNKQANLTLKTMKDGNSEDENMAGSMNINGICLVKDDFERLSAKYVKEEESPPEPFNPYQVV